MSKTLTSLALLALTATVSLAQQSGSTLAVDAKLPDYQAAAGVSGNLNSVGSDTLENLMAFWAAAFATSNVESGGVTFVCLRSHATTSARCHRLGSPE